MKPTVSLIETPRLLLRPMETTDVHGLFDLDSDPEVHRYLGQKPIYTLQQAAERIQQIHQQYNEYGIGRWAVIEKATQEFVGWSGIKYETGLEEKGPYYDLGYRLRKKFWGKGIATETSRIFLDYGFQTLKLPKLFAGAQVENIASNKVLHKVGFTWLDTFIFEGKPHHWYGFNKPIGTNVSND